ncbi:MAG TPA: beta-CASP ribonuclease aCPSF1, partial [Candidatus Aenigmarchaeota archaeon]|nr:beta-CASP ribonuclease aCPSF1 [Candidatus Aenigmarchaeota archaeon]
RIELEGSEIIVYTKDKEFFLSHEDIIRGIVEKLKKRIEVRLESNLSLEKEAAIEKIKEIVPEEAGIKQIYFEPERSLVIIAAQKPGLVIGKGGETFRKIKAETLWVPRIERVPPIKSDIIEGIRKVIHTQVKFRKEFLNKVGEKIFTERKTNRDWIRVIGLGGCREVGRSCILVETPKSKVLIDCGVNVGGSNNNAFPYFQTKEFDYTELDAIIVSHAHLDHIGCVPMLFEHGYDGPLYLTTPTMDLATLLWLDYIDVMQRNAVNPIFTAKGVKEAVKRAIPLEYGEVSDVAPDVRLTFQNAGHVLGSALIHLHIGEGLHNIVYACDMKFGKTPLLDPAFTNFQRVETLIIESTYGGVNDIMPPRREAEQQLMDIVNKTMERNGIVLIPSFAVERAQDVMAILVENEFQYPVFIDGMIWDATGIYTAYPEYMSRSVQKKIFSGKDPFLSDIFKRVASPQDREKVLEQRPCVIISTSGMLVGGPALTYLQNLAEDSRNTLIFVGYQGEGTLGRRIQKGWKEIPFKTEEGKTFTLNLQMEVQTVDGLSGHSDRNQLLSFVHRLASKPNKVIVVHGENHKTIDLARSIHKLFR